MILPVVKKSNKADMKKNVYKEHVTEHLINKNIRKEYKKLLSEKGKIADALGAKVVIKPETKKYTVVYHDLDHLAGTWDKKDIAEFRKNVEDFEKIDEKSVEVNRVMFSAPSRRP